MRPRWFAVMLILVLTVISFIPKGEASELKPLQWQWQNPPTGVSHLQSAAYGNGSWVVVGDQSLLTSTDGRSWEALTVNRSGSLQQVLFAGGQFVVVGTDQLLTSADGRTWTSRLASSPRLMPPHGIAYGNGIYVVISASSAYRSTDGVTWAEYLIPGRQGELQGITFGSGRFVAVGESGTILTSVDGIRWSPAPSPTTNRLTAVEFVAGKFLVGGEQFALLSSADGLSWKQEAAVVPGAQPGGHFTQFLSFGDQLLGLYDSMDTAVMRSNDGVTWELLMPFQSPAIYALAAANGQLLAVGRAGMILSSTDGRAWAPMLGGPALQFKQVVYGNGRFVAIGLTNHSGAIYSSADGTSWTLRSGGSEKMAHLLFADGRFLAIGYEGTFFVSSNGEDWNNQKFGRSPTVVGYGLGRYVGLGSGGRGLISTDGETWEALKVEIPTWILTMAYGNGLFVATGTEGDVYTSADGRQWTKRATLPGQPNLFASVYGNGRFVLAGDSLDVSVSTDGGTWIQASAGVRIAGLTYAEGRFLGVASSGQVVESTDGLIWRDAGSLPGGQGQLLSVAFGGDRYVAVGYDGAIAATGVAPAPRVHAMPAATVDPARSSIAVDRMIVPPDGRTRANVQVTLRDGQGNPVSGHLVELVRHDDDFSVQGERAAVTDQHGVATIPVWSNWNDKRGTDTFSAMDTTSNARLGSPVSVTASTCAGLFPDIPRKTDACRATEELAMRKLVTGFPDGRFYPDRGLTRAELAKLIVTTAGAAPLPARPLPFLDTDGHWAAKSGYIQAALELGAMTGFPDGRFGPDEPVTRAMLMKVVMVAGKYDARGNERTEYADVDPVAWYAPFVAGGVQAGLTYGPGRFGAFLPPSFKGDQAVTRQEAVLVIGNLLISRGSMQYMLVSE